MMQKTIFVLILSIISSVSWSQQNILFIAVDDLKPMGSCYDRPEVKTPYIDKLAQEGFVFKNNHCQQAVCAPTRASLLSGLRPDKTKVWDLKTLIRDMNPGIITLPQYLKQQGYQTAAVGKVFDKRSVDIAHDSVSWSHPYSDLKGVNVKGGGYIYEQRRVSTECSEAPDSITLDGRVLKEGIRLMDKMAISSQPFFLAVGFHKPHLPFVAPKKYWDLYDLDSIKLASFRQKPEGAPDYALQPGWEVRSQYQDVPKDFNEVIPEQKQKELIHGYYACVSFIDRQIGELIEHLDKIGLRENTIIVLWGDHGWHLGDHDMWCKHTNYEQATRSPLIISAGKHFTGNTNAPTEFVDVFPTLCDFIKVPIPQWIDGVSLKPLMNGSKQKVKTYAVSQFHRQKVLMGYAFRNERYRYVIWLKDEYRSYKSFSEDLIEDEELFDYKKDLLETKNVAAEDAYYEVKQTMYHNAVLFFKNQAR